MTSQNEIVSETNYYPFGLAHKGYNEQTTSSNLGQNWKFNGVELNEDFDLGLYEMPFRQYDPTIGRFTGVDALSEERYWVSNYNFGQNNPILRVDPTGALDIFYINNDGSVQRVEQEGEHIFFVQNQGTTGENQNDYSLVGALTENENGLVEFPASGENFGRYGTNDAGGQSGSETVGQGDHFVTPETAAALYGVLNTLNEASLSIDLGDMSSSNGSDPWQNGFSHHSGHGHDGNFSGLEVDFRYLNSSGESFQSINAFSSSSFSAENNQTLYDSASDYGFDRRFQGTSGSLSGATQATEHNNHGHIGRSNNSNNMTRIGGKPVFINKRPIRF